jgi:predicted extracellular nuclease
MPITLFRTPLYAAFFCAGILVACAPDQPDPGTTLTQCPAPTTSIANVQGEAPRSDMLGQQVTVQGIVTLIQARQGLYIEEPGSDANERTSNAIFVQTGNLASGVKQGTVISVNGNVSEIGGGRYPLTALTEIGEIVPCSSNHDLPLTDISLPLNGLRREALEGMRIQINDKLVVTSSYQFGRGKFTLSGNGLQFVPTEIMEPGPETVDLMAKNKAFALPVMMPESMSFPKLLVSGASINNIAGVVAHDGRGLRVSLQEISTFSSEKFDLPAAAVAGSLRVVGMNLHNYFNGDGRGFGFPTERGAKTADGFGRQRDRIGAAIDVLSPHVLAVMELENDGFAADSAAQDFIQLANDSTAKSWAVTRPAGDDTGTDKIAVGIFYRSDRLKTVGPAQTLTGPEFKRSRQPQAQLFEQIPTGERILIVINHLKSKGSCPDSGDNSNQNDGQACWNAVRRASAKKMSAWAKSIAASEGTDNILILGDMNAYRNEDPIGAIRDAGFIELMDKLREPTFSFVYYGQHGTLDYAFSSSPLLEQVEQAFIWRANTPFPVNMELPQPWLGFSDHDPVVVDIRSRHSNTVD